ncbi:MAG: tRNA (adenosine(37)-N6)-dimethylallyltransferase MiaA [Candidatus Paceibacterota bacterium]|jgi:tRNA dimethylallyltransferase|nr:tRNA (adenosine(37)-N6)-dimethylallyltransferase MiaA [Candidatus Paceibacterota bacterium]
MSADKKIIVVLGPTASGKSDLAVRLAKKFNGEIISADSRQVYKGMDIGTGKITKKEMGGITHHLLDVASPKRKFTVVQYRKLAKSAINKILKKGKVPIICGGTAFYIYAVVDGIVIPKVAPNWALRKKLERKTPEDLFNKLKKIDPQRAETIESKNKRRLIRAIEIVLETKRPVPPIKKEPIPYPVLFLGIKKPAVKLKSLIHKRLLKRLGEGMMTEVKRLKKSALSWERLEQFGLEYRYLARYIQGKIDYKETIERLQREIEHFSKRQMNWFKRDERIRWASNYKEAEKLVKEFLDN